MDKFRFECSNCLNIVSSFKEWFEAGQHCPKCGDKYVKTVYDYKIDIKKLLSKDCVASLWHYFDILPLNNKENITTLGEGVEPINRWERLESFVKEHFKIDCEIRVLRNDNNPGTGTFKDLAGTVVSSVLKENKVKNYVVASTGNIGAAFSRYLSINDITLYAFIPEESPLLQEAEIRSNGGNVIRVKGDYHVAKVMAQEFAEKNGFTLAATGIDPTRIEAKKTMIYEILRQLKKVPDIYVQALSGGTGPIGVYKGSKELIDYGVIKQMPKMIMSQSNKCAPMADGYQNAKKNNFEDNWYETYPVYENPKTEITTIATGNPGLYPYVARMVKESGGDILSVDEDAAKETSKLIALLEGVKIGPAAAIAMLGFFKSLKNNLIKNSDLVVINIGEGSKRSPEYMEQFIDGRSITDISMCTIKSIDLIREDAKNEYKSVLENL